MVMKSLLKIIFVFIGVMCCAASLFPIMTILIANANYYAQISPIRYATLQCITSGWILTVIVFKIINPPSK